MTTKAINLLGSILLAGGIGTITYLVLREKYDYKMYFKLGTIEEPPSQQEIDEFTAAVQEAYNDPGSCMITHKRVGLEKFRNAFK